MPGFGIRPDSKLADDSTQHSAVSIQACQVLGIAGKQIRWLIAKVQIISPKGPFGLQANLEISLLAGRSGPGRAPQPRCQCWSAGANI